MGGGWVSDGIYALPFSVERCDGYQFSCFACLRVTVHYFNFHKLVFLKIALCLCMNPQVSLLQF